VELGRTAEAEQEPGHAAGVLRNLMAGHFKGVADIRLRLNFQEEIAHLGAEQAREAAPGAVDGLLAGLDAEAARLMEGAPGEAQELYAAFRDQARAAAGSVAEGQAEAGTLVAAVRAAFEDFLSALRSRAEDDAAKPGPEPEEAEGAGEVLAAGPETASLISDVLDEPTDSATDPEQAGDVPGAPADPESPGTAGDVPDAPGDLESPATAGDVPDAPSGLATDPGPITDVPDAPADSATTPAAAFDWTALAGDMEAAFAAVLPGLARNMEQAAGVLPPLSEPSRAGRAYTKFLEMYLAAASGGAQGTPEVESEA
jgi:hypothetical protein